jgi:hypothetical protein
MACQAHQYPHWVNIGWVSAWSDLVSDPILDGMSGWPILTLSEYLVGVHLIWPCQPSNIGWCVRLTNTHTEWILDGCPPDLTLTVTQYWMACQAYQYSHWVNIWCVSTSSNIVSHPILDGVSGWPIYTLSEYLVGVSHPILDVVSGWPIPTLSEYWVGVHLIQPCQPGSIAYLVSAISIISADTIWLDTQYPTLDSWRMALCQSDMLKTHIWCCSA